MFMLNSQKLINTTHKLFTYLLTIMTRINEHKNLLTFFGGMERVVSQALVETKPYNN